MNRYLIEYFDSRDMCNGNVFANGENGVAALAAARHPGGAFSLSAVTSVRFRLVEQNIERLRTVIVMSQFYGPSPYRLQQLEEAKTPLMFTQLRTDVEHMLRVQPNPAFGRPEIKEVDGAFEPPYATTTYIEGPEGQVVVWKTKWDSSG